MYVDSGDSSIDRQSKPNQQEHEKAEHQVI